MSKKDFSSVVGASFNPFETKKRGDASLLMLDPRELRLIDDQLVPAYSPEELRDLAESIKRNGVLESLVVRKDPDGKYTVLSGRNRCRAALMAGKVKVPCHVVEVDDVQAELIMYDANFERREDIPVSVKVKVYKRKYELMAKKSDVRLPDRMAEDMGISRASAYRYLRLGKLSEKLLPHLDDGSLSMKAALSLADMEETEQEEIFERAPKASEEKIREVKERMKKGETAEEALKELQKPKKKKENKKQELSKESKEKILDAMQTYVSFVELLNPTDKERDFYRGAAAAINDLMCRLGQGELTEKLIEEMNRTEEEEL